MYEHDRPLPSKTNNKAADNNDFLIKLFCYFSFVNITRCPHTQKMGLIPTQNLACFLPQNTSNGFRIPIIEALDSSPIRGGILPTTPHLVVKLFCYSGFR